VSRRLRDRFRRPTETATDPIFVVGHPRSGATLVQTILAADREVSSGPETHFFTYVWGPTADTIPPHLLAHGPDKPTNPDPLTQLCGRLGAKPGIEIDEATRAAIDGAVGAGCDEPGVVLNAVMRALAPTPRPRWLEKTPRHVFALDAIWAAFPNALVVNVVRDPRSVVASGTAFARMEPGPKRMAYCEARVAVWRAAIRAEERDDEHLYLCRYEMLVTEPESTVAEMATHCGLSTDAGSLLDRRTGMTALVVTEADANRKDRVAAPSATVDTRGGRCSPTPKSGRWSASRVRRWKGTAMSERPGAIVGIIPARMGSSRFPGKPLARINGIPMVGHCYLRAAQAASLDVTVVATCDQEIADYAASIGARAIMTSPDHPTASDRAAQAVEVLEAEGLVVDIVVMIQGDEPLLRPEMVDLAVEPIRAGDAEVSNLLASMTSEEAADPNEIKVVVDDQNNALYMSRLPIPFDRDDTAPPYFKQVCIIPFTRDMLTRFNAMPRTTLETAESIDMMRLIERGHTVKMVPIDAPIQSVDTPEDLEVAARLLLNDDNAPTYA
jgi:3-deoxy-manno-octulosonate cytidylyltransferase (CMP-KDO synthetase)